MPKNDFYILFVFAFLLVFGAALVGNSTSFFNNEKSLVNPTGTFSVVNSVSPTVVTNSQLQLKTFGKKSLAVVPTGVSPTEGPTPSFSPPPQVMKTHSCAVDDYTQPITSDCVCTEVTAYYCPKASIGSCPCSFPVPDPRFSCTFDPNNPTSCIRLTPLPLDYCMYLGNYSCVQQNNVTCAGYCIGKPILYLYPQYVMSIDIRLNIPGTVTASDPWYNPSTGWQHVLAHPDGLLVYRGQIYRELYYETSVTKKTVPTKGIMIPSTSAKEILTYLTSQYGLNQGEQKEFLGYWIPRLQKEVTTPYLFISVLSPEQKQQVDDVYINPKPKTMISLLFYFKPMTKLLPTKPLDIPHERPIRLGFTAVEWGGLIDQ